MTGKGDRMTGKGDRMTEERFRIRNFHADLGKQSFKEMVVRAKRYIEAGDIYQANLSQRFSFDFEGEPERLYESLRAINPSPFSSFLRIGDLRVTSCSPERLIRKQGDACETRPIAGTRPRGETLQEEQRFQRELIRSPKERAEHVMLVDLERNDLGRVSRPNSVHVSELMTLERYSHVVHIVSNVVGKLRKDCDQFDLLRAVFPGGTITGCPKIRSMQIIEELEPLKRHLYTGSIGYLDFNGDLDLNIVIRSLILHRNKGYLQVGAGIVYDSDPEAEYWETLDKGRALVDALCETRNGNIH
jgi:para-aminobenzoate synthetase component I